MKKIISIVLILFLLGTVTYAEEWYTPAIEKAQALGIMKGDENGFRPDDYITRAEVAQVVVNILSNDQTINTVASVLPSTVKITSGGYLGSGFYVSENRILTATHVINGDVKVTLISGKEIDARVIKSSTFNDLTLLEVDEIGKPIPLAKSIKQGEVALVIGNPQALINSVSKGVVSSTSRSISLKRYMQVDAPINAGNSGGAIVNINGELIGLCDMKLTDTEGLGFGVHLDVIRAYIR